MDERALRDALWALKLPSIAEPVSHGTELCTGPPLRIVSAAERWMPRRFFELIRAGLYEAAARDPDLVRHLPRIGSMRHGLAYEQIVLQACRASPELEVLAHGMTVAGGDGITRGQADFLIRWEGFVWHLETAVKFYLRLGGPGDLAGYLGPSLRDRLDRKLAHMLFHQRTLLRHPDARAQLIRLGLPAPDHACISIRGVVFEPLHQGGGPPWWCPYEDLRGRQHPPRGQEELLWTVVEASGWFSPLAADEATWCAWKDLDLDGEFAGGRTSVCVAFRPAEAAWESGRGLIVRRRA